MDWARREKGLRRVVAITSLTNDASAAVLCKAGFSFERLAAPPGQGESKLYAWDAATADDRAPPNPVTPSKTSC